LIQLARFESQDDSHNIRSQSSTTRTRTSLYPTRNLQPRSLRRHAPRTGAVRSSTKMMRRTIRLCPPFLRRFLPGCNGRQSGAIFQDNRRKNHTRSHAHAHAHHARAHTHTHTHTHTHNRTRTCTCARARTYAHTRTLTRKHTHADAHAHKQEQTHVHADTHTHGHTHTHTPGR
jgi:hypothetical protein